MNSHAELLIAEIGSTTTQVTAFQNLKATPHLLAQGAHPTTVEAGDVTLGLQGAIDDMNRRQGSTITWDRFLAASSAAGGLRMTVHGLVYEMTVRAAKEAALGAGANLKFITAGRMRPQDLKRIKQIAPNIILLAGGVDYGERDTAIYNAQCLLSLELEAPVIYAGNVENQEEIQELFEGSPMRLYLTENVYPRIDELNTEPTRRIIQSVFEEHITRAAGMERIRAMVDGAILPTPGAVMEAAILLQEELGSLVCADIGGATTDIHSCTRDSERIAKLLLEPEPEHKRTVEGDLGLYVNRLQVLEALSDAVIESGLHCSREAARARTERLGPLPKDSEEEALVAFLAEEALSIALRRHAGSLKEYFGPMGRKMMAMGKDLTAVSQFIGTGGALSRLADRRGIVTRALNKERHLKLLPEPGIAVHLDEDYIMACAGVMSLDYPVAAKKLLLKSLGCTKED
ncbi:putative reactivating factor for D-ornithine aminomutase [Clostridiaceae bacterium JG1575]|nr:putative reactivating factor for D-ornithine aminomutase [Clostridiaceae bacterium JG1575]